MRGRHEHVNSLIIADANRNLIAESFPIDLAILHLARGTGHIRM